MDKPTNVLDALRNIGKDEAKAVAFFERTRWGDSPSCPLCGSTRVYAMTTRDGRAREKNFRWRCLSCKQRFTVRTGTVFAETRLPMWVWAHAYWRSCASKKGVSALQIKRECEISYPSALFLMHRVRYAMATDWSKHPPLSGTVEADETWIGGKHRPGSGSDGNATKAKRMSTVAALVERGGNVRIQRIAAANNVELDRVLREHVSNDSALMTDNAAYYDYIGNRFKGGHRTTNHSRREYAKPDGTHSNTAESVFSLLKRGIVGTWHSVSKHHLHRYLSEVEFRWNSRFLKDGERVEKAIQQSQGKRLVYIDPRVA